MPTLTRHQKPTIKLSRAWKFALAVLILIALVVFKELFFESDTDEPSKTVQSTSLVQSAEIPAPEQSALQASSTADIPAGLPQTATTTSTVIGKIKITNTPTGFLNVRNAPSPTGQIIIQVSPGSVFTYSSSQNGWYNINLPSGQTGWVSAQFTTTDLTTVVPTTKTPSSIKKSEDGDGADE
jgi:uncharacterized protein YgiM (DUF1202 family)